MSVIANSSTFVASENNNFAISKTVMYDVEFINSLNIWVCVEGYMNLGSNKGGCINLFC